MENLSAPVRFLRVDVLHVTQRELARRLGVTDHTVANWERGRVTVMQARHVHGFARVIAEHDSREARLQKRRDAVAA
jgi:predicted transcriptional regulator